MDRDPYAAPDCGPPPTRRVPMPAFSPLLLRAIMCTMGGLLVGGSLLVGAMGAYSTLGPARGAPTDDPYALSFIFVLIGGLPLLVIGAPGYALLVRWSYANAASAAVLGAAPGVALLLAFAIPAGLGFMAFGVVVSLVSHALFQWGMRRARSAP